MQQEDVRICVRPELESLEDAGIGPVGESRQTIAEVSTVGCGHHHVASRPGKPANLAQKLVPMRHVLDDFGGQDDVEGALQTEMEGVAWRKMHLPAFVLEADVASEIGADVVPGDFVPRLGES